MNISRFVALWNSGEFHAAHEVMEAAWLAGGRERGDTAHALTQLAVAAEHHRRGNLAGARRVFQKALGHIEVLLDSPGAVPPELSELRRMNLERVLQELRTQLNESAAPDTQTNLNFDVSGNAG